MSTPQAAPRPEKAKLNLTSVTPAVEPPEAPEIDTTTPIDVSIIPFTQRDFAKWGPWFFARLAFLWPHVTGANYLGMLMQHIASPGSLLIRSKHAVLLAVLTRESFDPRPIVDLVFCFKHRPDSQPEDKYARILFRQMEDWARDHGASGLRVLHPERCDLSFSRTKEVLWGDEQKYLLKTITK